MDKRTYVLMRAPQSPDTANPREIKIIDNSDKLGKKRIEKLVSDGFEYVGKITDTSLSAIALKQGISSVVAHHRDEAYLKLYKIRDIIDS